jgi:hypothetical protein
MTRLLILDNNAIHCKLRTNEQVDAILTLPFQKVLLIIENQFDN